MIITGILVARHLKTTDDLFDNRSNPCWAGRLVDFTVALLSVQVYGTPAQ
jgi:hypothetical protein